MLDKLFIGIVAFLGICALFVLLALLLALPVMWLWNAVVPVLFHLPAIKWLQALQLALLCNLLFKPWARPAHKS